MDASILSIFIISILFGVVTLLLVANELGRRTGLSLPGRFALMGGLGFGVIAFTIKAALIVYLGSLDHTDIAALAANYGRAVEARTAPRTPSPQPPSDSALWAAWRALPEAAPAPRDNPQTADKVALGRKLFFDASLSLDRTVSCASCHKLGEGGDDNASVSTGISGLTGNRNAPTVLNAAFLTRLFWDGRAASLEDQALGPFLNLVEMALPSADALVERVRENSGYRPAFAAVFGGEDPISARNIVRAIAAFERTLITPNAPYDRYVLGDTNALTAQQRQGMALFEANGCRTCHLDPLFSSAGKVKNFGTYRPFPVYPDNDFIGKYDLLVDGKPAIWRVPSLRNVALTGPYFHNGSVATLEEAVRVMAVSQLNKVLSDDPADDVTLIADGNGSGEGSGSRVTVVRDRALSSAEVEAIAAFLRSLSGPLPQM
ncbi:MAG: hypothetical protein C0606_14655 [Hyphomicrobiales bacterium]|nr:MAG: hypothetical protein C0606_14655 [Hyphomicrobiales bacterium]